MYMTIRVHVHVYDHVHVHVWSCTCTCMVIYMYIYGHVPRILTLQWSCYDRHASEHAYVQMSE